MKDIRAGGAFIEISTRGKAKVGQDLAGIGARLRSWASSASSAMSAAWQGMRMVGETILQVGELAARGLGEALKTFSTMGSELNDIAARSGMSVEALSQLGYAAEQTGASLKDLQAGSVGMSRFTKSLADGSKAAIKQMEQLGLSVKDFMAATPEERFLMMADALAKIEDPGIRAGTAMKVFGKSATALVPLLSQGREGVSNLMKLADAMGRTISAEDAAKADALGDSWQNLFKQWDQFKFDMGSALGEPAAELFDFFTRALAGASQFIQQFSFQIETGARFAGESMVGFNDTTQGIFDALMGMDFGLAMEIAFAGVGSVLQQLQNDFALTWEKMKSTAFAGLFEIGAAIEKVFSDSQFRKDLLEGNFVSAMISLAAEVSGDEAFQELAKQRKAAEDDIAANAEIDAYVAEAKKNELLERARAARFKKDMEIDALKRPMELRIPEFGGQTPSLNTGTRGSFNAAIASMLGRGGEANVQQQMLDELKDHSDKLDGIQKAIEEGGLEYT